VILASGKLADAIIASMSVPGLFPPKKIGARFHVDGGIANNIPVSVARDLCAAGPDDIIIAVDISEPPETIGDDGSFADVLGQMVSIMTWRSAQAQLASLRADHDILIRPDLGDFGFADFSQAHDVVPDGMLAAQAVRDRLEAISLDPDGWREHLARRRARFEPPSGVIGAIVVRNASNLSDAMIHDLLRVREGDVVDRAAIARGVQRIYGLDYFDSVTYALEEEDDGATTLYIDAAERNWGPDYVRFGVGIEDNFEGDANYRLSASYTDLGLNSLGGEWRTTLQIGDNLALATELYQPLDPRQRWFVAVNAAAGRRNLFLRNGVDLVGLFRVAEVGVSGRAGRVFGNWGALSLGAAYEFADVNQRLGPLPGDPGGEGQTTLFAQFEVDTLDDIDFPTRGVSFLTRYLVEVDEASAVDSGALSISALGATSWGRNRLLVTGNFGTNFSDNQDLQNFFPLGGFFNMSGFSRDALFGPVLTQAGVGYYRRLGARRSPLLDLPVYVGVSGEVGNVWTNLDAFRVGDLILGGSGFVALESPLGPIFLGGGRNTEGGTTFFLFVGGIF